MTNQSDDNSLQTDDRQTMSDGTETKALFVKHFSLGDWELLTRLQNQNGLETFADALRWAVRKASGVLG